MFVPHPTGNPGSATAECQCVLLLSCPIFTRDVTVLSILCKFSQHKNALWFISGVVVAVVGFISVGLVGVVCYFCARSRLQQKKKEIQALKEVRNSWPKCTKRVTVGIQVKRIFDVEIFMRQCFFTPEKTTSRNDKSRQMCSWSVRLKVGVNLPSLITF